ncbi:heavy metal-associated domain-containing protein [Mesorhizobium sp.]|uniref:heavy-metal-associated domain-containing protein n=1 Tax=Mesorhizobium sp. TaxID=1871066 RepID=UPI0025BD9C45|nr:heavy metal-associated domain-containing protein [Mesorhizobium sp.]
MMKKINLEVRDLVGIMDFAAVEKRLSALPGVAGVAMNAGSTTATVEFDEVRTNPETLAGEVEACGFHCRGETVPRHLCVPDSTAIPSGHSHATFVHAGHDHAGRAASAQRGEAGQRAAVAKVPHDAMAHEMGHGAGMDMQGMVKDMRNRFFISLVFALPIFAMEPMGLGEPWLRPPFGMSEDLANVLPRQRRDRLSGLAVSGRRLAGLAQRRAQHGRAGGAERRHRLSVQRWCDLLLQGAAIL